MSSILEFISTPTVWMAINIISMTLTGYGMWVSVFSFKHRSGCEVTASLLVGAMIIIFGMMMPGMIANNFFHCNRNISCASSN